MDIESARLDIVHGNHILSGLGVLDAFGHVSCRMPGRPDRFLMSCFKAPGLVTLDDVFEHDLNGDVVSAPGVRPFLERFIHSEIYRARPDVWGIVHSHSQSVLPFTVVRGARLKPICHTCGFLHGTGAPFDVADHEGPATDLLIRSAGLGRALAEHLGQAKVVLMRGHGFTAVGDTVRHAVYRAVYTGVNCETQMAASHMGGDVRFLTPEEASACEATTGVQADRAWGVWARKFCQDIPSRQ